MFVAPDGRRLSPPGDWACLPPGDAGLTRRVKAAGPSWAVIEKRGRKKFSKGLWAPRENIESARAALDAERSTEAYAKKREADVARRERTQAAYVVEFEREVHAFLAFAPRWEELGARRRGAGRRARDAGRQRHGRAHAAHLRSTSAPRPR